MTGNTNGAKEAVKDTIYRATMLLDEQKWDDWLALCDDDFCYEIKAWSPEINYDMTYLHETRAGVETLVKLLPKHNTDHSPLTRHTSVYAVDVAEDGKSAKSISSVIVHQHLLDGINSHIDSGESRLFLVGRYLDEFKIDEGKAKFIKREVRLENRRLDKGSHWPI